MAALRRVRSNSPEIVQIRDDSARAAEGGGPYEDPLRSGCRAGTCAPPFRCLNAAAHGWPPLRECGADSPGIVQIRDESARAAEGVGPYEDPLRSGCRAGTCAPPFRCLNAAAHGWPPYGKCGTDLPEIPLFQDASAGTSRTPSPTKWRSQQFEVRNTKRRGTPDGVPLLLELLGRFELPDVRCFAAAIRRGFDVLRTRSAVRTLKRLKSKTPSHEGVLLLELLGRFELPTSSLPRMRSTY